MIADYSGELYFDNIPAKEGGLLLDFIEMMSAPTWDVKHEGTPTHVKMGVYDVRRITDELNVSVPGLTIDEDLTLQKRDYKVPLRQYGQSFPTEFREEVLLDPAKLNANTRLVRLEGIGHIEPREIEVTIKGGANGDLSAGLEPALSVGGAIEEIIKLAVSATLKSAVKATVQGEIGIKAKFEVMFFKGYELKHV